MLFDHLPQQRRLDSAQREEVSTMLELKANKKLVQQHIASKSGRVVLLKDIHNVINYTQADKSKDFEAAIQELQKAPGKLMTDSFTMQINSVNMCIYVGAVVEVTVGSDNVLSGI